MSTMRRKIRGRIDQTFRKFDNSLVVPVPVFVNHGSSFWESSDQYPSDRLWIQNHLAIFDSWLDPKRIKFSFYSFVVEG